MVHVFSGQIGTYSLFTCASFQITFKSCRQAWKALYTASSLDRHELWFYPAGEQYSVSLQTCRAQASSIFWYLRHNYISRTRKLKHEGCLHASQLPLGTVNASRWHNTVIIGKSKFQHPQFRRSCGLQPALILNQNMRWNLILHQAPNSPNKPVRHVVLGAPLPNHCLVEIRCVTSLIHPDSFSFPGKNNETLPGYQGMISRSGHLSGSISRHHTLPEVKVTFCPR